MTDQHDELVQRSEDEEDYDLLTYGEVAARLSELIADERKQLDALRADAGTDPAAVAIQQRRIEELVAGRERYQHQKETSDAFLRKFGLTPRADV